MQMHSHPLKESSLVLANAPKAANKGSGPRGAFRAARNTDVLSLYKRPPLLD
jgi:hypothetical protein